MFVFLYYILYVKNIREKQVFSTKMNLTIRMLVVKLQIN